MGVPPAAAVRFGQPTSQQYNNQSSSSSRSAGANNHHGSASSRRSSGNGKLGLCDKIENYVAELGHWAVWRAIIIGQFLSLVLCFMTLLNHQINTAYQINLPTAQNLPHYVMMLLVYTSWMSCRGAGNGLFSVLRARGWRYLLLALIDVEANTLIAASHQFTSLASVQLLDCVAIPVALALSCLVLGVRYRMVHIVGVSICLMGVGCLVWAGIEESKDAAAAGTSPAGKNQLVGDMLCLGGAVLFSIITVLQELTVKSVDIIEYLGMMGFFGTIICGSQVAVLERVQLEAFQYENVLLVSFLVIYCITQFVFYSLIPVVLYETGATSLQLTLLTADFFNILLGMLIHQYKFHVLYFLSYVLVMTGIYTYAIKRTPMSTSTRRPPHSEPTAPDYRHMAYPGIGEVELCNSGTLDNMHGGGGGGLGRTSTLGSERESLPLSVSSDTAFTSFYGSQGNLKPSRSTARIPSATNLHDGSMRSS